MAQEIVEVPITGKIITVEVKAGDTIQEGDIICFIESMKMENPILAPVTGTITDLKVSAGRLLNLLPAQIEIGVTIIRGGCVEVLSVGWNRHGITPFAYSRPP